MARPIHGSPQAWLDRGYSFPTADLAGITAIAAGDASTCACAWGGGGLYRWGSGWTCKLGQGRNCKRAAPAPVPAVAIW